MLVGDGWFSMVSTEFPAQDRPDGVPKYAERVPTDHHNRLRGGDQPLSAFEAELQLPPGFSSRPPNNGVPVREAKDWLEKKRPRRQNHWPALVLALVAQAEELLAGEQLRSVPDVFATYAIEKTSRDRVVNTLNFIGKSVHTLRPKYNAALNVVRVELRRQHPSNAAHATQAWEAYRELIGLIYRASGAGRAEIARWVWANGVIAASERVWATQLERVVRPFEYVLAHFPTQGAQPGGALFQALVFGYFRADSPNLTLESHSVNTGSSRADMIGDVAGFRGGEVELAVEVKDHAITAAHVDEVLSDFLEDLVTAPNATAVVVAAEVDNDARLALEESNVVALSREDLRERVVTWDLPKQQEALRGAAYYLSRIQKKPTLLALLETFLRDEGLSSGSIDVAQGKIISDAE